jgi:hypothetical protein
MKIGDMSLKSLIFSGTRLLAMDDDLRTKASDCIETNFTAVLETREFNALPTIKIELVGRNNKIVFHFI